MSKGFMRSESEILDEQEKGFPHWETRLAAQLGISRPTIRDLRASFLIPEEDWKISKKRCVFSVAGAQKLKNHLSASKNGVNAPDHVTLAPPPARIAAGADNVAALPILEDLADAKNDRPTFLQVYRANFLNPRLVEAHRPGTDPLERANIQRVRVGSSANFITGMMIPCRHLELDYWELARPCPRWRGRW